MKKTKSGKNFFKKLLKDPSVRMQYEKESSKTKFANASMTRKTTLKDGSTVRYPEEKDLNEILKKLASDEVVGSTVIPKNAPESDKIKYKLCSKILEYKLNKNLTQKELAEKIGLDEPETSRVLHYKIERYSIECLLGYAMTLYPNLTLEVLAA